MEGTIDKIFDKLENEISSYIVDNEHSILINNQLQKRLEIKEQECKELRRDCMEIAEKLQNTIFKINTLLENAD